LGLLLLPWLLNHPWLQGRDSVPLLDDAQLLAGKQAENPASEDELLIKSHGNLLRINLGEVRYFYADNKYVTARGPEQEYIVDQSLKQLEERFGKHVFRVHRGYLVVTAFIRGLQNDALGRTEVILQDLDERVPVSRRYAPSLRQFLKDLVKP
jgi:two-component system response regulator AlgR